MAEVTQKSDIIQFLKDNNIPYDGHIISFDTITKIVNILNAKNIEIEEYKALIDKTKKTAIYNSKMVSIGEMASNISHEINNPLAIIQGSADVISMSINSIDNDMSKSDDLKQILVEHCEQIRKTTKRITKIITGLKRLSNSKTEFSTNPENIVNLLEESISMGLDGLKKSKINFSIKTDPDVVNLTINVPPVELSQVFINLFTNAHHALEDCPDNYDKIFIIKLSINDNFLEISFINSGPKISSKIQDKIFDSFFTTKPVGKGSGIGLSISKKIINEIGGKLFLDKNYESPKFVILLPINKKLENQALIS